MESFDGMVENYADDFFCYIFILKIADFSLLMVVNIAQTLPYTFGQFYA